MKIYCTILILILFNTSIFSQGYNDDKVSLTNFITRMYNANPFEGIKIIEDYNNNYLISVIKLDKSKYSSTSTMNRVALVKAQSQVNTFLNGSTTNMNYVVTTTEKRSANAKEVTTETVESIKQQSSGFVNGIELLTNFDSVQEENEMVFIYIKMIENNTN